VSDIIDSLRGLHDYVPIGSGQHEIQVTMLAAADALEAKDREIKRLYRDTAAAIDEVAALRELLVEAIVLIEISLSEDYDGADVEAAREWLAKQEDKP